MDDLNQIFPGLNTARICANKENHQMAAEIYSEILIEAAKNFKEDDPRLCRIYVEYASSLIINCEDFFTNELSLLANHKVVNSSEKQIIEDDLENAWNLLEIAKIVLAKEKVLLSKIYYLLGEILILNNNFLDAITEYKECLVLCEPSKRHCDALLKIASCYEFLKMYEESNAHLNEILLIYEKNRSLVGDCKADEIIEEMKFRMGENLKKKKMDEDVTLQSTDDVIDDEKVVININANKKKK